MITEAVYLAVGLAFAVSAGWLIWSALVRPTRDWSCGRGRWVTARVVVIRESRVFPLAPGVVLPAQLEISYGLDGQCHVRVLHLHKSRPSDYAVGQPLHVFVPERNPKQPRTDRESGFPEQHLNWVMLLVLLGGLTIAAGVMTIVRGG